MNKKNRGVKYTMTLMGLVFLISISGCIKNSSTVIDDTLFDGFIDPPSDARPFVRWWWNGNHLEKEEIIRQLDVLQKAGIGGVEINPIAMPGEANDLGIEPLTWISKEWNEMFKFASLEAQKRGMFADLIVGSGWPFGGEFLEEDETIQRIIVNKIPCSGGQLLKEDLESLYEKAVASLARSYEAAKSHELVFIRLVPAGVLSTAEITDLTDDFIKNNRLSFEVPAGNYVLVYGILQRSNREVMHGAPGAAGPVMNHYESKITRAYLNRLNKISEDTGTPLSELIRALFCDSIELDGANWTDGFEKLFLETYNYPLNAWYPFIFYDPYTGYPEENYEPSFAEKLKRVRYDYNRLLVQTFLKNFTKEFQDFCTENGVLCRYQAYGTPFLMGMMEGNMIADIPESNNWIYSADMDADSWTWNQGHGYMIWNMYAASGGHLSGKNIISNEAMTNTNGVFKTSLEEIKQHDDMNFITGMNHAVLHGYNYSPLEAGFPGWIRYGSYFNEHNTWWPYFHEWVEYNSRLSHVLQNSQPIKKIAILAPEADIWSNYGLTRNQFHTEPWYCYRLWEPISQVGSSCDYIGQNIIREGIKSNGKLTYGPMSYSTIMLSSVESMDPEAARGLLEFVQSGGTLIAIEKTPSRSLSFQNASKNDSIVQTVFAQLQDEFSERFIVVSSPETENDLLSWTRELFQKIQIKKDVKIDIPNQSVYQIHKKAGEKDIWFFTNTSRKQGANIEAVFSTGKKTPWIWDPETGTRKVFPFDRNKNELTIQLNPLHSMLLVFEPNLEGEPEPILKQAQGKEIKFIEGPWEVFFEHTNGESFSMNFTKLEDFGASANPKLHNFAGTVTYTTEFTSNDNFQLLEFENVNKGIVEIVLNDKKVGNSWYGNPVFNIEDVVKIGKNKLEIKYVTVLSNYVMSLDDNPTAKRWTRGYEKIPMGIEGNIQLITN
tara:strand:- start:80268 stop:83099 length:2832 start_codon:yes stop_codon:yes gene_type:complete